MNEVTRVFLREFCPTCGRGKVSRSLHNDRVNDDEVGTVITAKVVDWCDTCPDDQAIIRESATALSPLATLKPIFEAFGRGEMNRPAFDEHVRVVFSCHGVQFKVS